MDKLLAGLSEPDHSGSALELPHLTPLAQANVPGFSYDDYQEFIALSTWWIDRMIVTDTPLREKLVLLLHEQFPTSYQKVGYADLMYRQNELFRTLGPGSFEELTLAVAQDPAMLIWLDTGTDYKAHPNENFARELMERFTMGVGNYTEEDVRQSARAFTGWTLDYTTGDFFFNIYDHDSGEKRFLGKTGRWQGQDIINIVTHTTASSKWVVTRLWSWLAYPVTTEDPVVADLAHGYKKDLNVTNLLSAILHHPDFVSTRAMNGLVKQPVEYLVGTLRLLGLRTAAFSEGTLVYLLAALGQQLLRPPERRRLGPEPVLAVDLGEQQPAVSCLERRAVRRPHRSPGPERQPRCAGRRRQEVARNRRLVGSDLPGTLEDSRQGECAGAVGHGPCLSRIPTQLIGAPSWRSPSPDATFFPAASASVRQARCMQLSARLGHWPDRDQGREHPRPRLRAAPRAAQKWNERWFSALCTAATTV